MDRHFLETAREQTDCTIIGAESIRKGDPEFRISGGKLPQKRIRAVVTSSGNIPVYRTMFRSGPKPVIFCPAKAEPILRKQIGHNAEICKIAEIAPGILSLHDIIKYIEAHSAKSCLIEGGGKLNYNALAQGVVDEILITIAPKITGSDTGACLVSGPSPLGDPFVDLKLISCNPDQNTGEIFLRYQVVKRRAHIK